MLIRTKFLLYVVIPSAIAAAVIITLAFSWWSQQKEVGQAETRRLVGMVDTTASALAGPMWSIDLLQASSMAQFLDLEPAVEAVRLTDADQVVVFDNTSNVVVDETIMVETRPVMAPSSDFVPSAHDTTEPIGELTVYIRPIADASLLTSYALSQFLLAGVLLLTVAVAAVLAHRRLVTSPLRRFQRAIEDAESADRLEQALSPNQDEIGTVISAYVHLMGQMQKQNVELAYLQNRSAIILNNTAQGILTINRDLVIDDYLTKQSRAIFGHPIGGMQLNSLLEHAGVEGVDLFPEVAERVFGKEKTLRTELALSLLPAAFQIQNKEITAAYDYLAEIERIMVVLTDVTDTVALENTVRSERQRQAFIATAAAERSDVLQIFSDVEDLLAPVSIDGRGDETPLMSLYRDVHTIKGVAGQLSFPTLPSALHELESLLQHHVNQQARFITSDDKQDLLNEARVTEAMGADRQMLAKHLGEDYFAEGQMVRIHTEDLETMRAVVSTTDGAPGPDALVDAYHALARIHRGGFVDQLDVMRKFGPMVDRLADKLGKQVTLSVSGDPVHIDPAVITPMNAALVHVMRNAVAHGIETPEEREEMEKTETGVITCSVTWKNGGLTMTISDDGAGIDVETLRDATKAARASSETLSLLELMTADGVSASSSVDSLSGRGVGMSAVKATAEKMGGSIDVQSQVGVGTSIALHLPLPNHAVRVDEDQEKTRRSSEFNVATEPGSDTKTA